MKTIAVLIHSLTVEYAVQVLEGITTYYKDKDVRLVIFQIKDPHSTYSLYDHQCWTGIDYLQSNEIDGVIIISGSFAMTVTKEIFQEKLKVLKNKPIISIAMDLGIEGTTYTKIQCNQAFSDVIKHLIEKHNCKKIGFMSANQTISAEATQRFEAYKFALADNNLKYDDNIVFHGAFTQDTGYRVLRDRFSTKEEVNFDALLVANDNMALGCIIALQELGVKIPKDVKVVGFDNTTHAYMVTPKLSTIDQNISQQGYIAAEKMLQLLPKIKMDEVERAKFRIQLEELRATAVSFVRLDQDPGKAKGIKECRILEVNEGLQLVILSAGYRNGVRVNLTLYADNGQKTPLRIVAVRPFVSAAIPETGKVDGLIPGMKVRNNR